jgi:integrase
MAGKRRHGEGSITKRTDGRYQVRLSIPGQGRKSFYARTYCAAQALRKEKLAELQQGTLSAKQSVTLATYLPARLAIKPLTYETYDLNMRRVLPHLGHLRLDELRPGHVQDCYNALLDGGLSARSVKQAHLVLHKALKDAMKLELVQRNVTEAATAPRPRSRERPYLTPEELNTLFETTYSDRFHALWVLLGTTGLRIGEALGLKWSDLDLSKRTLVVRRALQRQTGAGLVFVEPKSASSRRRVELMNTAREALQEHRERQAFERKAAGRAWQEHCLVFPSKVGTPLEQGRVHKQFKCSLEKAALPNIRIHDLRHTAASIMLEQGVHIRVVQEMLGHSSFALTATTYSHVSVTMQREAVDRVDALLSYRSYRKHAT